MNNTQRDKKKSLLTLNITYHPAYARLRETLTRIQILLAPNEEHRKVFPNIPVVGFRNGKSLRDILVRAKLPQKKVTEGGSNGCKGKRCEVCNYITPCSSFSDKNKQNVYNIKSNLNCNSKMVVYLVSCKTCNMQYVGSTSTKFRLRFNNYRSGNRKYNSNETVTQESFFAHFNSSGHNGIYANTSEINTWQIYVVCQIWSHQHEHNIDIVDTYLYLISFQRSNNTLQVNVGFQRKKKSFS